jgi:hypothetical protein
VSDIRPTFPAARSEPPPSCSNFWVNFSGVVCFFFYCLALVILKPAISIGPLLVMGFVVTIIPVILGEIFIVKSPWRPKSSGVQDGLRGWSREWAWFKSIILRLYFLPLMFLFFIENEKQLISPENSILNQLYNWDISFSLGDAFKIIIFLQIFFATVDVLFAAIGYLTATRFFNSHIQSTEPTPFGWFIGLIVYFPFWDMFVGILGLVLLFQEGRTWTFWLDGYPVALVIWGSLILIAQIIESSATVTFGIRFSNLTWRGLISNGPLRYSKHPQYIAKMFNRFLVYIPFFSPTGSLLDLSQTLGLFMISCTIYFFRARTEENHLSRFPEYVAYANWMNDHGIFRWVGRICPALRYNEERRRAGKLF